MKTLEQAIQTSERTHKPYAADVRGRLANWQGWQILNQIHAQIASAIQKIRSTDDLWNGANSNTD